MVHRSCIYVHQILFFENQSIIKVGKCSMYTIQALEGMKVNKNKGKKNQSL